MYSCSKCDISYFCTDAPECCAYNLLMAAVESDVDVSCRSKGPPCVVPPDNDPCDSNSCLHGAPCGVGFQFEWQGDDLGDQCVLTVSEMCHQIIMILLCINFKYIK